MVNKLSCSSNLYASHNTETVLKCVSSLGCNYIDLWYCPTICSHVNPIKDKIEEVKQLIKKYNLGIAALTIYYTTHEEKIKSLEFASELEIPYVVFEPSPVANFKEKMTNIDTEGRTLGEPGIDFEGFLKLLNRYVKRGEELGVKIALEVPHVYTLIEKVDQIKRTLNEISSNYLELALAPPHVLARGGTIMETIERVGDKIGIFYLWDVKEGYKYPEDDRTFGTGEQQIPGLGSLNFEEIINALKRKGFKGFWDITCHGTESWTDGERITELIKKGLKSVKPHLY